MRVLEVRRVVVCLPTLHVEISPLRNTTAELGVVFLVLLQSLDVVGGELVSGPSLVVRVDLLRSDQFLDACLVREGQVVEELEVVLALRVANLESSAFEGIA